MKKSKREKRPEPGHLGSCKHGGGECRCVAVAYHAAVRERREREERGR